MDWLKFFFLLDLILLLLFTISLWFLSRQQNNDQAPSVRSLLGLFLCLALFTTLIYLGLYMLRRGLG